MRSAGSLATIPSWKEVEVPEGTKSENASYPGPVASETGNPVEAKVVIVEAGSAQEAVRLVRKQYGDSTVVGSKCLTCKSTALAETGY